MLHNISIKEYPTSFCLMQLILKQNLKNLRQTRNLASSLVPVYYVQNNIYLLSNKLILNLTFLKKSGDIETWVNLVKNNGRLKNYIKK